jgi:hypothetical protein
MVKKYYLIMCFISIALSMTACSAKARAFAYLVPIGDMNGSIKLQLWNPDDAGNLRIGNEISLSLSNVSYYDVSMPYDFGMYVLGFDKASGEWKDVPYELLSNGGEIERGSDAVKVQIRPQIESDSEPVEIRVVVTGDTSSMTQSKQVGAYIDLTLQP